MSPNDPFGSPPPDPQRPTFSRLGNCPAWRTHYGFDSSEWAKILPDVELWIEQYRHLPIFPKDLPKWPWFIFGPSYLVRELSIIGADAFQQPLDIPRGTNGCTALKREQYISSMTQKLGFLTTLVRDHLDFMRQRFEAIKAEPFVWNGANMRDAVLEEFGTHAKLEAYISDPVNGDVVTRAAILFNCIRLRYPGESGTVKFLDAIEHMALGGEMVRWSVTGERGSDWPEYCCAVEANHELVHPAVTVIAVTRARFDELKLLRTHSDSVWTGNVEKHNQHRQQHSQKILESQTKEEGSELEEILDSGWWRTSTRPSGGPVSESEEPLQLGTSEAPPPESIVPSPQPVAGDYDEHSDATASDDASHDNEEQKKAKTAARRANKRAKRLEEEAMARKKKELELREQEKRDQQVQINLDKYHLGEAERISRQAQERLQIERDKIAEARPIEDAKLENERRGQAQFEEAEEAKHEKEKQQKE
ncbi:hypothetical protein QBC44DRAFT_368752 [Cladorrhinum sp. PSN332]|nr:hypothetical protein QBC44DRAFT_368752 [Cladorrhinum sp. PSN332]